jgi:hypothetical protein
VRSTPGYSPGTRRPGRCGAAPPLSRRSLRDRVGITISARKASGTWVVLGFSPRLKLRSIPGVSPGKRRPRRCGAAPPLSRRSLRDRVRITISARKASGTSVVLGFSPRLKLRSTPGVSPVEKRGEAGVPSKSGVPDEPGFGSLGWKSVFDLLGWEVASSLPPPPRRSAAEAH